MPFSAAAAVAPGAPGVPTANERAARLVDAASVLANESGSSGFTVAQVAERAGSSLKGFYRCFASKDELLVALLAAESHTGAAVLGEMVRGRPGDPLHTYVTGIFELAALPAARGYSRVLVQEHRRLAERQPAALDAALAPLVDLLARITGDQRDAQTIFGVVLGGVHDVALGRGDARETAEYLARFCRRGLDR